MELFDQLYERRVLVRLVGVRFSHLLPGTYQMNLFEDTAEMVNLYQAMDRIRNRYGQNESPTSRAANRAESGVLKDSHNAHAGLSQGGHPQGT